MANTNKQLTLVSQLIDHTRDGSLRWEKTSERDAFVATFPSYKVLIWLRGDVGSVSELYRLRVTDDAGSVMTDIGDIGFDATSMRNDAEYESLRTPLADLYRVAKASANGTDDATIDSLLKELSQLRPSSAKAS